MKKIIFVHLLNDYSGSPKVLSQVVRALQRDGYEVELYTGESKDGFLSHLTPKHHMYFYKRFDNKYLTLITFMLSQVSLFFKLLKYKDENVLIYVNTLLPFGAGLAGKYMQKKVFYHVHETSIQPAIFKKFLRSMVQKTASKVFFVSNSLKESESFIGIPQEVIYNAISDEFLNNAKQFEYKHKKDGFFSVLMICSLKAYKGVDEFVKIAQGSSEEKSLKFTLLLNAEQEEIVNYFKEFTLPKNLNIISRQKNVLPFYEDASLVMNLSRIDEWIETFGLTILEAISLGIPVIVPPVGGPTEIVRDGVEGYQISSYDIDTIIKTIINLADDEKKCLELSEHGKKRAEFFNEKEFEKSILKAIDA